MKKTTKSTKRPARAAKKVARFGELKYKMSTETTNYKLIHVHFSKEGSDVDAIDIAFVATCSDILDTTKTRIMAKTIVQWVEEFLGTSVSDVTDNELEMAMNLACRSSESKDDPFVEAQKKTGFKLNSVYFPDKDAKHLKLYVFSVVRC